MNEVIRAVILTELEGALIHVNKALQRAVVGSDYAKMLKVLANDVDNVAEVLCSGAVDKNGGIS